MKLVITFETSVLDSFHDKLMICSNNDFKREIELHAFAPQASIVFEPFINFGFVKMGKQGTEKCKFKNEGKLKTEVVLKTAEEKALRIDPEKFSIESGQEVIVGINYKPEDAGIFRGLIEVESPA